MSTLKPLGVSRPRMQAERVRARLGFTLIELIVAIAVIGILTMIAVPSFNEIALSSKLNSVANSFVASAHLARSEAIKRNSAVTLCASSDESSCTDACVEEDSMADITLEVDGREVNMNPFVRTFIERTVLGMITSLSGVDPDPKRIAIVIDREATAAKGAPKP